MRNPDTTTAPHLTPREYIQLCLTSARDELENAIEAMEREQERAVRRDWRAALDDARLFALEGIDRVAEALGAME
jgi:hypothetical protein